MGPTGCAINVIQVHPTRRCNLRCRHCYSTSGPEYSSALPAAPIVEFLREARTEGFNAMGVSGGEPFTYGELSSLLEGAKAAGYATSVTTNGLLLDAKRLGRVAPHLDLLAISLDGVPASHNRMRARADAFEKMCAQLPLLREQRIPFGFIFTLTLENLHELAWAARFASEQGASLLQVHPLERVGRAKEYTLYPPDDLELSYAFVEVARLKEEFSGLAIQFDVADRILIEREPWRAFVDRKQDVAPAANVAPLASLVSPLVLQEDGHIVPIQHGFDTAFAVGHLFGGSFREQALRWKRDRYLDFSRLADRTWSELREAPEHLPFTNWYSKITEMSAIF